jgi:SAM-dependent methyltransferase
MHTSTTNQRARVFGHIYARNRWHGTETRSGPGSTLASTRRIREALPQLLAMLDAHSLLDAACGASWWMPEIEGYIGVDIVPDAVAAARAQFPTRQFEVADIVTDDLPEADVAICRDVLAHLPRTDQLAALANLARSVRWLFVTTFAGADNTRDASAGGYHEYDLSQPPYNMSDPFQMIPDGYWEDELIYPTKYLGLYLCGS